MLIYEALSWKKMAVLAIAIHMQNSGDAVSLRRKRSSTDSTKGVYSVLVPRTYAARVSGKLTREPIRIPKELPSGIKLKPAESEFSSHLHFKKACQLVLMGNPS